VSSGVEPDPVALADLITSARLSSYLAASRGDLGGALALYDWNTRAAAAVLASSAMVEVIVRNSLDGSLQNRGRRRDLARWEVAPAEQPDLMEVSIQRRGAALR
jgi:hypothetical protein